jgi:peptide deformylase
MRILVEDLPQTLVPTYAIDYQRIKSKSINLKLDDPNLFDFVQKTGYKMVKTCVLQKGIGLSACQIGIFKTLFIIQDKDNESIFDMYINPTWKPKDKIKITTEEGCLSVPGKTLKISRYKNIEVDYWYFMPDNQLINIKQDLSGRDARVFQHEHSHTLGVSIVDVFKRQKADKK